MSDETGITIVSADLENFRRLRVAKVEYVPGKGLVRVTGETAEGKTSFLKAIAATLFGAGEIHPDSIHADAEGSRLTFRLSNGYTAERRLTRASPKGYLDLIGPDGPLKNAQTKLNEWVGPRTAAPLEFFRLKPDKQRDVLFSIATDADLPEKLAAVRAEYAETYEERTPIISRLRELAKIGQPEGERPEPVDTSEEMARLRVLQDQERERGDAHRTALSARDDARDAKEAVEQAKAEVKRLEKELAAAHADLESKLTTAFRAQETFENLKAEFHGLPDPSEEMQVVQDRIAQASEVERSIEPWRRWEQAQLELAEKTETQQNLTLALKSLKEREAALLRDAGIPVPGLSFGDDGEPLLNGRSLALASGRERIEVAVAVAMAAEPNLKIVLLDEANDLGLKDMERLDALAKEHGFQIWAVRIGLEGDGEIVVEDGEAWGRDDVPDEDEAALASTDG